MNVLKNKIVHCNTEDEAKKLMQIAEDEGYIWSNGDQLTHYSGFGFTRGLGIVYYFDDVFEFEVVSMDYLELDEEEIKQVVEFTELFPSDQQQETRVTNHNTTLGEKILVKNYEDDDWQERYFLTAAHGYVYATATEDGNGEFATAWKYGIKKEVK